MSEVSDIIAFINEPLPDWLKEKKSEIMEEIDKILTQYTNSLVSQDDSIISVYPKNTDYYRKYIKGE